jgi:sec-independent protein translocase protein TatC
MAVGSPSTGPATGEEPGDSGRMTLVEHLAELRGRLIKALLAVAVGGAVGFALYDPVLDQLVEPYCALLADEDPGRPCRLVITDPLESFSIRLKVSAYLGLLIASPVVLWQLWRFITPGLYPREKRYAVPFVVSSIVLFVLGALLALWTFPRTLEFLSAFAGESTEAFYTPGKYLGLLTFMMLAFGIGFEFPVVLVALQAAGVLHWRRLVSWRRYAVVVIFLVGAVITPSGDPVTLCALAVPMLLFYEGAILLGRFVLRRP